MVMVMVMATVAVLALPVLGKAVRPHVSAGFGCRMASSNTTEYLDYRWDVLDSLHYHDAISFVANGTTVHSTYKDCDYPHGPEFKGLVARARASGVSVWLSTGNNGFGSFGPDSSAEIITFLTDETARWRAINSSLDAVQLGGLDGLSLDIEGDWRFNHSVREPHSRFLRDFSEAGRKRSPPIPIRYPVFWDVYKDAAVDMVAVTNETESTVLMTYDYHWSTEGIAGPNCPLINCATNCSGEPDGVNVKRTVKLANSLSQGGVSPGGGRPKFLLGIAWYGLEYPTNGPDLYGATNYSQGPKRNYQVGGTGRGCGSECRANRYGKLWDETTQTPWYKWFDPSTKLWNQGYYDDARSVAMKYALAATGDVSGFFIWPLNGNSVTTAPWAWEALVKSVGVRPGRSVSYTE
jgi:spore germination protein YaaH